MNTPAGIISVIATSARPESAMQATYVACIALRYWVFIVLLCVADLLNQARVFRAVLVAHRLGGFEESVLVRGHELDARGLELGLGLARVGVPELALLHLGLARELLDQVLVGLRKLV